MSSHVLTTKVCCILTIAFCHICFEYFLNNSHIWFYGSPSFFLPFFLKDFEGSFLQSANIKQLTVLPAGFHLQVKPRCHVAGEHEVQNTLWGRSGGEAEFQTSVRCASALFLVLWQRRYINYCKPTFFPDDTFCAGVAKRPGCGKRIAMWSGRTRQALTDL